MPDIRTYVEVVTEFDADGTMVPLSVSLDLYLCKKVADFVHYSLFY